MKGSICRKSEGTNGILVSVELEYTQIELPHAWYILCNYNLVISLADLDGKKAKICEVFDLK